MRNRLFQISLSFIVMLGVVLGLAVPGSYAFSDEQQLLSEVWRIVDRTYVDDTFNHQNWWFVRQRSLRQPLPDRDATYDAIQQMLASLDDPFTRLLKPDQYRSLRTNTSGELTGVGLQIAKDLETGDLQVIAPIEASPADQAGIQPRDRIMQIDGRPTRDLTLDEAADQMRGVIGSPVTLTIARDEEPAFDLTLVRDRITLNPVYADLRIQSDGSQIGYIRLKQFNANAAVTVADAIAEFEAAPVDGYILDLRNNPGGLLQAGIEVAQLWLDEGPIVYTVNRQGVLDTVEANGESLTDAPLAVLVNQGTASASEILAGALQDQQRAKLVGERTFGKGLIQSLFNLSDGSGLAVTIAKYETPDHHDINRQGIQPDLVVQPIALNREDFGTDRDPQYRAAVDLLTNHAVVANAA
ncbi:carboxyl-terminal processing protease CtpA [Leptolyngbya sp. CCY15150]|uniref:carboxyl-terminal processing protease CtpA n=1 Tax=Leptolyngbya sp. CCY15150 TaxID=2767772 RepID=UPI00194F84A5|nr:carboxyl-terminal processing protease CtpA [Leptolyngbya sp. CCY15150]